MTTNFGVKYTTARDRVFQLLSDLDWHSWKELKRVGGVRYSARILELKRLGYRITDQDRDDHGKDYKLLSLTPTRPQRKRVKVFLEETDAQALLAGHITNDAHAAIDEGLKSFQANKSKL